jgi:hypothetical protein
VAELRSHAEDADGTERRGGIATAFSRRGRRGRREGTAADLPPFPNGGRGGFARRPRHGGRGWCGSRRRPRNCLSRRERRANGEPQRNCILTRRTRRTRRRAGSMLSAPEPAPGVREGGLCVVPAANSFAGLGRPRRGWGHSLRAAAPGGGTPRGNPPRPPFGKRGGLRYAPQRYRQGSPWYTRCHCPPRCVTASYQLWSRPRTSIRMSCASFSFQSAWSTKRGAPWPVSS